MLSLKTNSITAPGVSSELNTLPLRVGRVSFVVVASGDATYTVEHTLGDGVWLPHAFAVDATGTIDGNYVLPIAGIRLNVSSITTGDVFMRVIGV